MNCGNEFPFEQMERKPAFGLKQGASLYLYAQKRSNR